MKGLKNYYCIAPVHPRGEQRRWGGFVNGLCATGSVSNTTHKRQAHLGLSPRFDPFVKIGDGVTGVKTHM